MFAVGAPSRKAQSLLLTGAALLVVGVGAGLFLRRRKKRAEAEAGLPGASAARRRARAGQEDPAEAPEAREARLVAGGAVLVILPAEGAEAARADRNVEELAKSFCGTVITGLAQLGHRELSGSGSSNGSFSGKTVYLCGDVSRAAAGTLRRHLDTAKRVFIIGELSHGYGDDLSWRVVGLGRVPILVHGVGVFYRRFFEDCGGSLFDNICSEHTFQTLTESNKPGTAHRTGAYLTPVEQDGEDTHFRLLRCSTNLSGPTLNFGASDRCVVDALNQEADCIFENQAPLNHVLAQVYHNSPAEGAKKKQIRAKIKAHADKTKDMPESGIMAFCTFYDRLDGLRPMENDTFDYGHKRISALTKLHFRLKDTVKERPGCSLAQQFSVTLYPDSVFFMPLSTNRLYTHEIRPGQLDVTMSPTRLGYVVRCSETEAVHKEGHTFLKTQGKLVKLEPSTAEGVAELKRLYAEENITDAYMDYGQFLFSMNRGDYTRPMLHERTDEFRRMLVSPDEGNPFAELLASVRWEDVGKGRQGTVLVRPEARGTPIVRTTTKYAIPAQSFRAVHERLAQLIQKGASLPIGFNNALIENYTNAYATMGFHSDQALDLEDGTFIALYSCYRDPELANPPPRKLVVESKEPGGGAFEIPLAHNSVVVFSLDTNRRFKHKIVLDSAAHPPQNQWLGVTFRTSKTFVQFHDGQARLETGAPLALVDDAQRREFFGLRKRENAERDFTYPRLAYTISPSDAMPPTPA